MKRSKAPGLRIHRPMSSTEAALVIDTPSFHYVVQKLRSFFLERGFLECHTQNRLSILAACDDPSTITTFQYVGQPYPLPQTGQMWLEYELLKRPQFPGYFCVSTSYRQEPNPIPGRHDLIFPMFEFELKGGMEELERMERDLLEYLGYGAPSTFPSGNYTDIAEQYGVLEISHAEEQRLAAEKGAVFFLKNFPEYTSPFWNMQRNAAAKTANKIDVILSGMETIGSAERSTDVHDMLERFTHISNGMYAKTLFNQFGKERVMAEMNEFLGNTFMVRSGGGIGLTRLISSMKKEGLIPPSVQNPVDKV